ncbi:MAG: alpha-E protein [Proteobacteria bacterium]|nr:alpha-E protein [Pseudomonadota bacterium]
MAMLSRVAEHLYWMARYLERAESTARLVSVNGSLILDLPKSVRPGWAALIAITGSEELFNRRYPEAAEGHVVKFMLADEENPGSILSSIRCARENARTVRDIIPREAWEQINELHLKARSHLSGGLSPKWRYAFLNEVILSVQMIAGVLAGGMSHDDGFEFMTIGCNLERADMTTRIIDVRSSSLAQAQSDVLKPFESILWMSVLKSLTAYQMSRRHMQAGVGREAVLKFLLQDPEFPRAFYSCLCTVRDCLTRLPRSTDVLEVLLPLKRQMEEAKPENLSQEELTDFIDTLQIRLGGIHSALAEAYFGASAVDQVQQQG